LTILFQADNDIICALESFNYTIAIFATAVFATPSSSNLDINIEYLSTIKEKLTVKKKLRKLWQTNRLIQF